MYTVSSIQFDEKYTYYKNNMNIKLLDCTVRDGGYINDWNFGHDTLISLFERITASGIDFIEVGFLDQRRPFDINRSIAPSTATMDKIYNGLDKHQTQVVGMIDYGTCGIENISPCCESFLDGIRVIFKKQLMKEALGFAVQLKELGYKVFTQAVSITSYNDDELIQLMDLVNEVKPYAVSIVDTYGLLHKDSLFHYYDLMNNRLNPEISIGYHSHNNFQLGYANCIELMNRHGSNPRQLLLDGSIYGMGKGAGNAPTELLAMYMNDHFDGKYDISQLLEAIDVNLMDIFRISPWGYTMTFFISASNDCHPQYVFYLLDKKTLSVKSINEILKKIPDDKKLMYDNSLIEQLYIDYQKYDCDDSADYQKLTEQFTGKDILIIGPGESIENESEKIKQYIDKVNPVVIAINFIPEKLKTDYLFLTNSKRYVQQTTVINNLGDNITLIATSNLTKTNGSFDYNLDYEPLIDRDAVFMDNSFIMLLKVMIRTGVKHVALAGFDGYSSEKDTYYYSSKMEYDFAKQKGNEINLYVNGMIKEFSDKIKLNFITSTVYKHE